MQDSLDVATGEQDGSEVWLGGMTTTGPIHEIQLDPPAAPTSWPLFYVSTGAPVLAWLVAGAWLLARRWRGRSTVGPVHQPAAVAGG